MGITRQAIRVYAALDALKDRHEDDVLDALVPFLMPIIQVMKGKVFAPNLLVLGVRKLYGWNITTPVAEVFRDRLIARNVLKREYRGPSTVWICDPPPDSLPNSNEIAAHTALDEVIDDFEKFPPRGASIFHSGKTREELSEILVKFLISLDAYSRTDMAAELRNISRNVNTPGELAGLDQGIALTVEDNYLCALFVGHLHKTRSPLIEHLSKIASVGLLTEVVTDFVKPTTVVKRPDLTIALDTSLALDLLGASGNAARDEAGQVATALRSIGCQFVVFKKTCEEISRVLTRLLATPREKRYGITHSAMLKGEVDEKFVRHLISDPEGALTAVGVPIKSLDLNQFPNQHHHFSAAMYDDFLAGLGWYSDEAREHDAECVALVVRLRAGTQQKDPLSSKYVFTTSNSNFARYSRDFCVQRGLISERHCGPVLNYRDLATAAWLRTGLAAGLSVPMSHLLAACDRVLQVRKEVIEKARVTIGEVRPERIQQFELLLLDGRSVAKLMDATVGGTQSLQNTDVDRMLDDMLRATTAQAEAEFAKKLEAERGRSLAATRSLKESHKKDLEIRDAAIAESGQELTFVRDRLVALETERAREEAERSDRFRKIVADIAHFSKGAERICSWVLWLCAGLSLVYLFATEIGNYQGYPIVKWVSVPITMLAIYHFIEEIRQKPKRGLDDLLTFIAGRRLRTMCSRAGLSEYLTKQNVEIKYGQVGYARDKM